VFPGHDRGVLDHPGPWADPDAAPASSATTTTTMAGLPALQGRVLGTSDWFAVTQAGVDAFADATHDHEWIHVDVARARAESPFGGPIAHGHLTLSHLAPMVGQVLQVTDAAMTVNYGLDRVRFPAPVPVGARIRMTATLADVHEVEGGLQLRLAAVIEAEGTAKPVCVAEPVFRSYRELSTR